MTRCWGCGALLLSLSMLIPAGAGGQDKPDAKKKDKDKVTKEDATTQDYAALAQVKEIEGKIAAVDVKGGTMTLTIEFTHLEPNKNMAKGNVEQKLLQQMQQIQREYDQAMKFKNAVQRQQALLKLEAHIQKLQANGANLQGMFKAVKTSKDFDLEVMDSLKVARATPEMKYDDEGEIIKYTDEQLKKMKSTDVPGGYTASGDDLKVGQTVKLWLSPPKTKKSDKKSEGDKKTESGDTKDDKDKGSTDGTPNRPQVRMALIEEESDLPEPKGKDKGKKKKQ
jgi:hypothetical protein